MSAPGPVTLSSVAHLLRQPPSEPGLHTHHSPNRNAPSWLRHTTRPVSNATWPLHEIAITNILWCMACKKVSGGGRILCNSRAIVLQWCGQCRWGGAIKEGWIHARSLEVKEYFVKAKAPLQHQPWPPTSRARTPVSNRNVPSLLRHTTSVVSNATGVNP